MTNEWKTFSFDTSPNGWRGDKPSEFETEMPKVEAEGWEVVSISSEAHSTSASVYCRRPAK